MSLNRVEQPENAEFVKKHGTIKCLNTETGVIFYAREDMMTHPAWKHLKRLDVDEPVVETVKVKKEEPSTPDVIQTKAGKPFKTETAARNAMKTKKLSDHEYMVMPVADGFIIAKV